MFEATLQLSASSLHESETVLGLAQQKGMQAQFELEQLRIRILAELAGVEIGEFHFCLLL